MLSKIFQGVIDQINDSYIDRAIGVIDVESSRVIVCSDVSKIGKIVSFNKENIKPGVFFAHKDCTYKYFNDGLNTEFLTFIFGTDEVSKNYACLITVSMENALKYYNEKHNKTNFIRDLLLDNILFGDVYLKSKELGFLSEISRVCMVIEVKSKLEIYTYEILGKLFPDKNRDFIISINETTIVLVKEVPEDVDFKSLEKIAEGILEILSNKNYVDVAVIGIGLPVNEIKDLTSSFKEAKIAVEVGKVFETQRNIVSYTNLGIARLIHQLPTTLCEAFLKEVFKNNSLENMDQESLFTVHKFFENSLNVSETSRKLYVHRNTLVYRLEKIRRLTGLDLREFEDAIVFKFALMVKKYLSSSAKY
ncbi:MAG: helix-turn-helix domain-containing protein [Candidatus Paraimprobicoccus trichonymphae]|uniref:Helix-turn-helix domain-containing protein n=1 Tax=Candidatus Paraimprobicoccus trichonymphae TaxID=3033793 RepID=A0AA48L1J1_9FIRM|nr:MAG: helix-turn-helix domain-containing protein [Candidatus Paraimprobicoccus trichonymphae]